MDVRLVHFFHVLFAFEFRFKVLSHENFEMKVIIENPDFDILGLLSADYGFRLIEKNSVFIFTLKDQKIFYDSELLKR